MVQFAKGLAIVSENSQRSNFIYIRKKKKHRKGKQHHAVPDEVPKELSNPQISQHKRVIVLLENWGIDVLNLLEVDFYRLNVLMALIK